MKSKKNFFTHICYILFVICTLVYIAAYAGAFESLNVKKAATAVFFALAVLLAAMVFCRLLAIARHRKKVPESLNYRRISRKKYEYAVETILVASLFIAAAAVRLLCRHEGMFAGEDAIFDAEFLLNNLYFFTGALFMFFSIRFSAGRLAALLGTAACLFWPSCIIAVFLDTAGGLATFMILWELYLWFVLFFRSYNAKGASKRNLYISISLLGLASNLTLFASDYAFLFILSMFAFMLFKYWKPALLYLLFSLPALCLKIGDIVIRVLAGNTDEFYKLLDFNITVSKIELFNFSDSFFDINVLLYLTVYLFALISVIFLYRRSKKPFQIFMLYTAFASFLGRDDFIFVISADIFLAAYMVQLAYSHMVKKRCIRIAKKSEKRAHKKEKRAERKRGAAKRKRAERKRGASTPVEAALEPPSDGDGGSLAEAEPDISSVIPKYVSEEDYTISTSSDYGRKPDQETIDMLKKRRERVIRKIEEEDFLD